MGRSRSSLLAQQSTELRPNLVRRFSNDGLAFIAENVPTHDLDALEPPSTMNLPLDGDITRPGLIEACLTTARSRESSY